MKSIELFAGGGGLAIGLDRSGFDAAAIIEYNKDACLTLSRNYLNRPSTKIYEGDIRKFNYSEVGNDVALVSGGPPCQPFSMGGKHKAFNDDRDMFPEAVRAIRELRPKAFIFENVKGLLREAFAEYFEYIILQLQYPLLVKEAGEEWSQHLRQLEKFHTSKNNNLDLNYKVVFRLLNAADYGVPQRRERVFIVGFRSDIDVEWSFPAPTHSSDALEWSKWVSGQYWIRHGISNPLSEVETEKRARKLRLKYGFFEPATQPWVTVRDAIADLPDPVLTSDNALNHEFKDGARSYPGHTGSYIDEPSKTLKAGGHGVPGGENMIRFEDGTLRYFTVRESARIQTFPDDYRLEGAWGEAMRQIGNAVPVRLAEAVGTSVRQVLV
ncbi:modification methylase AplI [Janthinobacterium sp. HH107]|uniref:DNA cytosine methyltransferase n=1 Tax=Janthinobacterium sp. HH107 TaxID=1537279 RepID=UPI000892F3BF|nr:DNA cytosine methyltransferase [Janthinobacterium sp. HH107]OEZ99470.1 modification methylase AplI [Janthinobacterium sp. HH107]